MLKRKRAIVCGVDSKLSAGKSAFCCAHERTRRCSHKSALTFLAKFCLFWRVSGHCRAADKALKKKRAVIDCLFYELSRKKCVFVLHWEKVAQDNRPQHTNCLSGVSPFVVCYWLLSSARRGIEREKGKSGLRLL